MSIDHECMELKRKASLTLLLTPHSPFGRVFPHSQFNATVYFSAKFISAPNEKLSEVRVETVRLRRAGIDRLTVKTTSGTTRQVWRQSCESDEEGAQDNIWAGNKKEYSIQESVNKELDFFFFLRSVEWSWLNSKKLRGNALKETS